MFLRDSCGHYASHSLFLIMSAKYFTKTLFSDITEYVKTCDTCQLAKRNFSTQTCTRAPSACGKMVRSTLAGNTAILVIVNNFSGWPILIPVKDMSAACAFVKHVIAANGLCSSVSSNKGPCFMSSFFTKINKKHLKNVGPIRHCEPPHAHSPGVASGTVARRLRIDVHDNNNDDDNDNA